MLRGVLAEVAKRLLEQVAVRLDRESLFDLDVDHDAVVRLQPYGNLVQQRCKLDGLDARRLLPGVRACERQHCAGEARQPAGLALDVGEETVALGGILLRARLEQLDRADDRRQRGAQLVRRVRHELALGELSPLLLGQIVDHDERPVGLGLGRNAGDRVGELLVGPHMHLCHAGPLVEEGVRELP